MIFAKNLTYESIFKRACAIVLLCNTVQRETEVVFVEEGRDFGQVRNRWSWAKRSLQVKEVPRNSFDCCVKLGVEYEMSCELGKADGLLRRRMFLASTVHWIEILIRSFDFKIHFSYLNSNIKVVIISHSVLIFNLNFYVKVDCEKWRNFLHLTLARCPGKC